MVATQPHTLRPSVTLHEPATLLTDCLLALLGGSLTYRLHHGISPGNTAARWWVAALFVMSISAIVGGSYHGFGPNFPAPLAAFWWKSVLILVCTTGFCMGVSLIREIVPPERQRLWHGCAITKFMLSVAWVIANPRFFYGLLDYGLAMVAWAVAALVYRRSWSGWVLAAVGLSTIAGWVQQSRWGISTYINHNDVYHLIQALALIGFYRTGHLLSGMGANPNNTR
jgi:hypothetical protein